MKYVIQSIDDIESIREGYNTFLYDEIVIEKSKIKKQGVFRWALKYAFWNLKVEGKLRIIDVDYKSLNQKKKKNDFWRTKQEVFKVFKEDVKSLSLKNNEIIVEKLNDDKYINNGVSVGIVFSGSKDEEPMLFKCLDNIFMSFKENQDISTEVVICGPSDYDRSLLTRNYLSSNCRYIIYDHVIENGRVMIGKKKNYLYQQCTFNIVSILHTRILIEKSFTKNLFDQKFDFLSPKVLAREDDKIYDYISYHLIGSYNINATNIPILTVQHFDDKYLFHMANRYPYVDGGIMIFNKKALNILPFNPYVAWDEAEDVECSSRLHSAGFLIDYSTQLVCTSQTKKFILKPSIKKRIHKLLIKLRIGG